MSPLAHTCSVPFCFERAEDEEAHLVARADRTAGRRESRYRYGIDHGSALLQRQRAQQQPGQGPGWPSARFANDCISSCIGRMYLSRSNASRDLLRTKTGARRRHVREHPSNPHGRAMSETAAAGTCAKDARRQIVPRKAMSVRPLNAGDTAVCKEYLKKNAD